VIRQGGIWWAELPQPRGSEPGFRRPVVVVQGDAFNKSRINTVLCVAISSNLRLADAPGNVMLPVDITRLPKDSVANVSQVVTLDRSFLSEYVGELSPGLIQEILDGILLVLGM
jgi:mRNA interferase MazF